MSFDINWLAVLAAAVSAFVLGGIWYGPLFKNTWCREAGIDLSAAKPQLLTPELAAGAGWLVTMGCADACPILPGTRVIDWPLPDPKGQPADRVREIRDEIRRRVEALIAEQHWA